MKKPLTLTLLLLIAMPLLAAQDKPQLEPTVDINEFTEHPELTIAQMKDGVKFSGEWFMSLSQARQIDIITGFIGAAKRHGVTMRKDPLFYLRALYAHYDASPEQKQYAIGLALKTVALLCGDYQAEGMTEEEVFKDFYGDTWEDMHTGALEARKKLKEKGFWKLTR